MKMNSLNKFLFLFKKSGNNSTQKCSHYNQEKQKEFRNVKSMKNSNS